MTVCSPREAAQRISRNGLRRLRFPPQPRLIAKKNSYHHRGQRRRDRPGLPPDRNEAAPPARALFRRFDTRARILLEKNSASVFPENGKHPQLLRALRTIEEVLLEILDFGNRKLAQHVALNGVRLNRFRMIHSPWPSLSK